MKQVAKFLAFIGVVAFAAALISCASTPTQVQDKPYYNYRAEMQISLGTQNYQGMTVTKLSPTEPLVVKITSPITLNRVDFSTCGRHNVVRNTDSGWFDKVSKIMSYTYVPTKYEQENSCSLFFQAFNDNVQKAWGIVFFRNDQNLPAHIDCNGIGETFAGITTCQTKAGIEQQISFQVPVKFAASPECTIVQKDPQNFLVKASSVGWCAATFSDGKDFHDLHLLGYDEVINY